MRLAEARGDRAFAKYLERRSELGIDTSPEAPLVVDPDGKQIPREAVVEHLRFASTVRRSIEGNAELCTGLLAVRYRNPSPEEATA